MKQKIFKNFALLLSLLTIVNSFPVYAYNLDEDGNSIEKIEYDENTNTDFENSASVFAEIGSVYKVTIPKVVVLSGESKDASYIVKVEGDIAGYESIFVVPDDTFNLYSSGKDKQVANVSQDKTSWTASSISSLANGKIQAPTLTAGKWTGTFNFDINFNKEFGDVINPDHVHILKTPVMEMS